MENGTSVNYPEVVAHLVKEHSALIFKLLVSAGHKMTDEAQYRFSNVFQSYLNAAANSFSRTKTLLYRHVPVPLYSFYVPLDLQVGEKTVRSAGIREVANIGSHIIVSGIAGTGKSTFLKHLFLDAIRLEDGIPVFIELRKLNVLKNDLKELLHQTVQFEKTGLGVDFFDRALESGQIILLLDAYDELNLDRRDSVRNAIFQLVEKFPKLQVIVTSRPDSTFVGWSRFTEVQAQRLSKQQALSLIDKLEYNQDVKRRFIHELDRTLYDRHESFLSNPLLLTIMLMTYHDNAEIPTKKHLFFSQVFHTLYSQHDALKDGYKRELFSGLAMDDFQKVLAALSIQSFVDGEVTFGREKALDYLLKAKEMTNLKYDADAYLDDLLKSVCLLMQDGLFYTFTHKQFQEYYTAIFIASAPPSKHGPLLKRIAPDWRPNDTIRILFEISQSIVEKKFVLPGMRNMLKRAKYEGKLDDEFYKRMFMYLIRGADRAGMYYLNSGATFEFIRWVKGAYKTMVSMPAPAGRNSKIILDLLRERQMTLRKRMEDGTQVSAADMLSDARIFKALKAHGVLAFEDLRYLIDVKDFVEVRQGRTEKSIDSLLR